MRRILPTTLFVLSLAVRALAGDPVPPATSNTVVPANGPLSHQRVLVLGDSITQDGRYVTFIEYYLHRLAGGETCDLISIGLSSETISGLTEKSSPYPRPCVFERLDRALEAVKPQVVLACYGMNDGIYHPAGPERLAAFKDGLHRFVTRILASGAQLVLVTPPPFDPRPIRARTVPANTADFGYDFPFTGYDEVLAEFARTELGLHLPGVTVIDLHSALAAALAIRRERDPAFDFNPDGVHPNDTGHLVIARTLLAGLGYVLAPADADAELARLKVDPIFALVRDRRELRSEAWLPFVGYTRGPAFKSDSVKAAERVAGLLESEIDAAAK